MFLVSTSRSSSGNKAEATAVYSRKRHRITAGVIGRENIDCVTDKYAFQAQKPVPTHRIVWWWHRRIRIDLLPLHQPDHGGDDSAHLRICIKLTRAAVPACPKRQIWTCQRLRDDVRSFTTFVRSIFCFGVWSLHVLPPRWIPFHRSLECFFRPCDETGRGE